MRAIWIFPTFLLADSNISDNDRCSNETIRDGCACCGYYDIVWKLENKDDCTDAVLGELQPLAELEQQVFASFLEARNLFAPEYPVLEEQCRVLSASSSKKVSLHITIPQYVFEDNNKHMKAFMDNFKAARGTDAGLTRYIDLGVYTKNRGIRILGSVKCADLSRKLVRAGWHAASREAQDGEFFFAHIHSKHTKVAVPSLGKSPKKKKFISGTKEAMKQPVRGEEVGSEEVGSEDVGYYIEPVIEEVVKDRLC